MKKILAATLAVAVVVPVGIGEAHNAHASNKPTANHAQQYTHLYKSVRKKFGARTPGRQILKWGLASGRKATDGDLVKSIAVLNRMLAPPPVVAVSNTTAATATSTGTVATATTTTASSSGGLVNCIIQAESSGNPTASNGSHSGLGGWSATAWAQDGGTKYASSPTGATYQQQVAVLSAEGSSPQGFGQQTNFDPC